ncbi:MAG: hypothetical protein H7099_15950 [Gemmatimonadaceae bacterium]|nr:hypothetical protein [Gemmatimonadaceae bacterium]
MTDLHTIFPVRRNVAEYAAIGGWWVLLFVLLEQTSIGPGVMTVLVLVGCITKAILFGTENMKQLFDAAKRNLPHHQFLLLMGVNMSQMILSFMFDFQLLQHIDPASFSGVAPTAGLGETLFDFFYLSTLNFSFFGYSDVLPQTVPARIANLTEILLAFVTVIFLLSDFISLKDSLRHDSKV